MTTSDYLKQIKTTLAAGNATEHTYRSALQTLVQNLAPGITATNEPKREACGAPDYIITKSRTPLGYIETKDVGKNLDEIEKSEQLKRYKDGLTNLVLTNYLEFRWYVAGEHRLTARLGTIGPDGKIREDKNGATEVHDLLRAFLTTQTPTVKSPKEHAARMAALARQIRHSTLLAIQGEDLTDDRPDPLHEQMEAFRKVLLHDLTEEQFADMYAQTICYGLFAARCNAEPGQQFTREHAAYDLPKTNPFLKQMFSHIAGPDLSDSIAWAVDDLAYLLNRADIDSILENFGKRTRQEDPVVHFYETFLAHYDQKMREARGVYYTPEPVVSYIVRSVDHILKTDFGLPDGLADSSKVKVKNPGDKGKSEVHKVQILDPATGTGTFLHGVIDHIHESFAGNKGMWSGYVRDHLLPRLHGFELLMAPYAVAHMKLGLQLKETGYDFGSDERLKIFLTNTLEDANEYVGTLFASWLSREANAAGKIKKDAPVMVVLGNPPYSGHSANKGEWISGLLRGKDTVSGNATSNYFEVDGHPLGEKNPKWLNDDYVKFIRFAQWRIERTGYGVLAFITNHGYLDNPTFRGMRQSLMETFDDLYLLDLHGNAKKKERCPDGSEDKNVFDIQQGVSIGIFVKRSGKTKTCTVRHADLWGSRDSKYKWLWENDIASTIWDLLRPSTPHYFLTPKDTTMQPEYDAGWSVVQAMPINSVGIATARDALTIGWNTDEVWHRVVDFTQIAEEEARAKYKLGADAQDWHIKTAQLDVLNSGPKQHNIVPIYYRPFDVRFTYYTGQSRGFICRPRNEVMTHMLKGENVALLTSRLTKGEKFAHAQVTQNIAEVICMSSKTSNNGFLFPLYLYPNNTPKNTLFDEDETTDAPGGRRPNLAPEFIADFSTKLGMSFIPDGKGDRTATFGPEDVFSYMYAVFHSPTYRTRYAEFLRIDFPRLPLTSNPELFRELCTLGDQLVSLHLMETRGTNLPGYPVEGDNTVENVRYSDTTPGRVYINSTQYFEPVPSEVWNFHIGGYQVAQKWLKDRKGRKLEYDDLKHYQSIIAALSATIRIMAEIDTIIGQHGCFPIK